MPRGSKDQKTQVVRLGGRSLHRRSRLISASPPLLFPEGKEIRFLLISPYSLSTLKNVVSVSSPWHFLNDECLVIVLAGPACSRFPFLRPFLLPFLLPFLVFSSSSFFFSLPPFKARSYSRSSLDWNHHRQEPANLPSLKPPPAPQCLDHGWAPPCPPHQRCHRLVTEPSSALRPQTLQLDLGRGRVRGSGILVFLHGSQVLRISPCFALPFLSER